MIFQKMNVYRRKNIIPRKYVEPKIFNYEPKCNVDVSTLEECCGNKRVLKAYVGLKFKCFTCNMFFHTLTDVRNHVLSNNESHILNCLHCDPNEFNTSKTLEKHIEQCLPEEVDADFYCMSCNTFLKYLSFEEIIRKRFHLETIKETGENLRKRESGESTADTHEIKKPKI